MFWLALMSSSFVHVVVAYSLLNHLVRRDPSAAQGAITP